MTLAEALPAERPAPSAPLDEVALVQRCARGDLEAFERLMRQHNGALFRVARAILKDDADAEDALQEAYLSAYRHLADFKGDARLSTWLTRIVINQALGQLRTRRKNSVVVALEDQRPGSGEPADAEGEEPDHASPEGQLMRGQMRQLLERKIDALPLAFRTVFVMREVQEMTVEETSACLCVPAATVRTRLFRARSLLRESLVHEFDLATGDVFSFGGAHCDRIVAGVLAHLRGRAAS